MIAMLVWHENIVRGLKILWIFELLLQDQFYEK